MSPLSTSISKRPPLAAVCRRGLLFLAPILLSLGFCELIFWRARESWPASWVVDACLRDPQTRYGPRFFAQDVETIKTAMIRAQQPAILALGSSRVTQFRAPMFGEQESQFYNAGLLVTSAPELLSFTDFFLHGQLPAPRAIILNIDPWWIKQRVVPDTLNRWQHGAPGEPASVTAAAHLDAIRRMIGHRQIPWGILRPTTGPEHARNIGWGAHEGNCFRADGSVQQTSCTRDYLQTKSYRDRETPPIIERIRNGRGQFAASPGVDWEIVDRIVTRLRELQASGIEVYTFLPPFAADADREFRTNSGTAKWAEDYHGEFQRRLTAAGIFCLDVTTPSIYGLSDDYMMDGFHPGDVLVTHILEDLVRRSAAGSLLKSIDVARLQQLRNDPRVIPVSLDPAPAL